MRLSTAIIILVKNMLFYIKPVLYVGGLGQEVLILLLELELYQSNQILRYANTGKHY